MTIIFPYSVQNSVMIFQLKMDDTGERDIARFQFSTAVQQTWFNVTNTVCQDRAGNVIRQRVVARHKKDLWCFVVIFHDRRCYLYISQWTDLALRWCHSGHHGVSNYQFRDCSLNCLFRRRSRKTPKLHVTGLCAGNSPGTGDWCLPITNMRFVRNGGFTQEYL